MGSPGEALERMRAKKPLIHNITNYVAMAPMANILLAAGASPAMIHAFEEVAEFASLADALTINIGPLSPHRVASMTEAADAANRCGKPWVFDPVAAGATEYRRTVCQQLLERRPTVIRGIASEIIALTSEGGRGRGVDSTDSVAVAAECARELATRTGAVVAATGPIDFVTDGDRSILISKGSDQMSSVTAMGCSLTGVVAAFVATNDDTLEATTTALLYYALAGERAARFAHGPATFAVRFVDALAEIEPHHLDNAAAALRRME